MYWFYNFLFSCPKLLPRLTSPLFFLFLASTELLSGEPLSLAKHHFAVLMAALLIEFTL